MARHTVLVRCLALAGVVTSPVGIAADNSLMSNYQDSLVSPSGSLQTTITNTDSLQSGSLNFDKYLYDGAVSQQTTQSLLQQYGDLLTAEQKEALTSGSLLNSSDVYLAPELRMQMESDVKRSERISRMNEGSSRLNLDTRTSGDSRTLDSNGGVAGERGFIGAAQPDFTDGRVKTLDAAANQRFNVEVRDNADGLQTFTTVTDYVQQRISREQINRQALDSQIQTFINQTRGLRILGDVLLDAMMDSEIVAYKKDRDDTYPYLAALLQAAVADRTTVVNAFLDSFECNADLTYSGTPTFSGSASDSGGINVAPIADKTVTFCNPPPVCPPPPATGPAAPCPAPFCWDVFYPGQNGYYSYSGAAQGSITFYGNGTFKAEKGQCSVVMPALPTVANFYGPNPDYMGSNSVQGAPEMTGLSGLSQTYASMYDQQKNYASNAVGANNFGRNSGYAQSVMGKIDGTTVLNYKGDIGSLYSSESFSVQIRVGEDSQGNAQVAVEKFTVPYLTESRFIYNSTTQQAVSAADTASGYQGIDLNGDGVADPFSWTGGSIYNQVTSTPDPLGNTASGRQTRATTVNGQ